MFAKFLALCAVVAVSQAGLLPAAVQYSPAAAVSSQNIVRHDESRVAGLAAPGAYRAAPVAYSATPVAYSAARVAPIAYSAAPVAYRAAPIANVLARQDDEYAHPKYEYNYSVADAHTGDNKQQQEVRDGDVVRGSYSFHEADGSIRTVEYSADDHTGFNAVVHNTAPAHGAAPALVRAAPVAYSAPASQYYH